MDLSREGLDGRASRAHRGRRRPWWEVRPAVVRTGLRAGGWRSRPWSGARTILVVRRGFRRRGLGIPAGEKSQSPDWARGASRQGLFSLSVSGRAIGTSLQRRGVGAGDR